MSRIDVVQAWLARGETYYNIQGDTQDEVLESAVKLMPPPKGLTSEEVLAALIAREHLMSTAIGLGFAVPHPREPIVENSADSLIAVCYLEHPVVWAAPDDLPVRTLFIVLSADHGEHLAVLSTVAEAVQREDFRQFLTTKPTKEELIAFWRSLN